MFPLTHADAEHIYDILVASCGARESERAAFVENMAIRTASASSGEYRLNALLGFGGKLYWDAFARPRLQVGCYPEDRTSERKSMISLTNTRLTYLP